MIVCIPCLSLLVVEMEQRLLSSLHAKLETGSPTFLMFLSPGILGSGFYCCLLWKMLLFSIGFSDDFAFLICFFGFV